MSVSFDVVIIGGGASGAVTAAWLLRQARSPLSVALVDQRSTFGTGLAYGTTEPRHLLNVPAAKMSADPADPDHLLRWLAANDRPVEPGAFIPRMTYGRYLASFLNEAEANAAPGVRLHRVHATAERLLTRPLRLSTSAGELGFRELVLALGNPPPAALPVAGAGAILNDRRYLASPWSSRLEQVPRDARVSLIGTGLTALDVVLSLQAQGHRGMITLLSRHGLLPREHASVRGTSTPPPAARSPRALLSWIRREPDWRAAIDSLRPVTADIWRGWSDADRRTFERHLRRLWEVHRHRMAPEISRAIETLMRDSKLRVLRGRLRAVRPTASGIELELDSGTEATDVLINCTGPAGPEAAPLVRALVAMGVARADRYGISTRAGNLVDATGHPVPWLHAIGPLRRAELFESTAIPEIRSQARDLASRLLARVGASDSVLERELGSGGCAM
jgi:uncharacterized NAD(P)/FAD-binding protein YdhS